MRPRGWFGACAVIALAAAGCSSDSESTGIATTTAAGAATTVSAATTSGPGGTGETSTTAAAGCGGSIVVGIDADPSGFDPAGPPGTFASFTVFNAIYDTIMTVDIGEDPEPLIAASLIEDADRMSWTLEINEGVTFHDGTVLDADGVKFNLDRNRSSIYNTTAGAILTGVEVVDPLTVRILVAQPFVAMPTLLAGATGVMVSPTTAAAKGAQFGAEPAGGGSGPYLFDEWVRGDRIVLKRNPDYWGPQKPQLDEIVLKVIVDDSARVAALEAGDVDATTTIFPETADLAGDEGFDVFEPPNTGFGTIHFNLKRAPFDDVRIRRAMWLALDLEATDERLGLREEDIADRGFGPFPRSSEWYAEPDPAYSLEENMDEAKRLVAEYEAEKGPVEFTLSYLGLTQQVIDVARLDAQNWGDAGMDVTLDQQGDTNQYVINAVTQNFDVLLGVIGLTRDPDLTVWPVLDARAIGNLGKYDSAEMNDLISQGRSEADPAARKEIYAAIQQLFREDVPFIIGAPGTVFVMSSELTGIEADGFFPAKTAARDC